MDNKPISCFQLGEYFQVDGKQLQQQYKEHISDYSTWEQREHAAEWMVFEQNTGVHLSIDETSLSNGELYTIVTNKAAKGRKGSVVAMTKGTQSENIIDVLRKIPERTRKLVTEVTLDMAANIGLAARRCFPHAHLVIDRFHVQQLAFEAVQELRIKYRWQAIDQENDLLAMAKKNKVPFAAEVLSNGDTMKQLLARSRYLLFKHQSKWTQSQQKRAELLFQHYPLLKQAYDLSIKLGNIFKVCTSKEQAFKRLALWYNDIEASNIDSFKTVMRSVQTHYSNILNYFNNKSTNAAAESFNAKIKAFRSASRGVRDINFFLYRLSKIYA